MAYLRTFNFALSSLLVMGLAACSSDDAPDNGGQQINTQAEGIGVLLNETAGRVTNFTGCFRRQGIHSCYAYDSTHDWSYPAHQTLRRRLGSLSG